MAAGLAERVAFLGVEWGAVPFLVTDLSGPKRKIGVDGILGVQDLMGDRRIRIDYERGEISQLAGGLSDGWPIYFTQGRALVSVEGRMDQGLSGLFRIDTGGARSMLTKEYLEASLTSGARWNVGTAQRETRLVFREAVRERRYVAELLFRPEPSSQGVPLSDVPVDTTAADDVIAYAGKLGADAFAGRVLELDYPACRMRLAPLGEIRGLTSSSGEF